MPAASPNPEPGRARGGEEAGGREGGGCPIAVYFIFLSGRFKRRADAVLFRFDIVFVFASFT